MGELTIQELIDYLNGLEDKTGVIKITDDNGNATSAYIDGNAPGVCVFLGQCCED